MFLFGCFELIKEVHVTEIIEATRLVCNFHRKAISSKLNKIYY